MLSPSSIRDRGSSPPNDQDSSIKRMASRAIPGKGANGGKFSDCFREFSASHCFALSTDGNTQRMSTRRKIECDCDRSFQQAIPAFRPWCLMNSLYLGSVRDPSSVSRLSCPNIIGSRSVFSRNRSSGQGKGPRQPSVITKSERTRWILFLRAIND